MDDLNGMLDSAMASLESSGFKRAADAVERASNELTRLRAEVEVLRADAERWEHARSIACFTEDRDMGPGGWWTVAVYVKRRPAANTIDAAVDAARAAQGELG